MKDCKGIDGSHCKDVFLTYSTILPWELFMGPPRWEIETWIHESPIPVPTGITTSPQASQSCRGPGVQGCSIWIASRVYRIRRRKGFLDFGIVEGNAVKIGDTYKVFFFS
jgi:hypothetical protein